MKNMITLCLMLAAALQAVAGHALEQSTVAPVTTVEGSNKASTGSFDSHNTSFLGNMTTSLTTVSNQVKNVETCNAQGKVWNGTACVDLMAAAQPISTTAIMGPSIPVYGTAASRGFTGGDCCAWYYSYTCTCTSAETMPAVRRYGNLVIVEPRTCITRGPSQLYPGGLGKGTANPDGVALNYATQLCASHP